MQITGKIKAISDIIKFWQKQTEKQTVKIEEEWQMEEYKRNSMVIDFFGKMIPALVKYKVGDTVTIDYNCRTSLYNEKTYNNISWWSIKSVWDSQATDDWDLPF